MGLVCATENSWTSWDLPVSANMLHICSSCEETSTTVTCFKVNPCLKHHIADLMLRGGAHTHFTGTSNTRVHVRLGVYKVCMTSALTDSLVIQHFKLCDAVNMCNGSVWQHCLEASVVRRERICCNLVSLST